MSFKGITAATINAATNKVAGGVVMGGAFERDERG